MVMVVHPGVQTLVSIILILSSPFIILANVLIVSAWFRFKRLRTPSNALIVSLAISDLGFGLSLPIVVIYQILSSASTAHHSAAHPGLILMPSLPSTSSATAVTTMTMIMTTTAAAAAAVTTVTSQISPELPSGGLSQLDTIVSSSQQIIGGGGGVSGGSDVIQNGGDDLSMYHKFPIRSCATLLTFSVSSLVTMAAIAMDRFTSVAQPLRYNHFVTTTYVHRFILAIWLLAFTVGMTPFIDPSDSDSSTTAAAAAADGQGVGNGSDQNYFQFQGRRSGEEILCWVGLLVYLPCLLCAVLSYSYIYMVARGHSRAIYMVEVSLNHGDVCHLTDTSIHHHRYGLTLAFLMTIFVMSWAPIFVSSMVDHFAHTTILQDGQLRAVMTLPTLFSPLLNPLLYGFRSSEIRVAVIRIVDNILSRISGRPYTLQPKGEWTSCASNVRLLAVSPTQTTVHCCPTPTPTHDGGRNHLQILLCDQTSL